MKTEQRNSHTDRFIILKVLDKQMFRHREQNSSLFIITKNLRTSLIIRNNSPTEQRKNNLNRFISFKAMGKKSQGLCKIYFNWK